MKTIRVQKGRSPTEIIKACRIEICEVNSKFGVDFGNLSDHSMQLLTLQASDIADALLDHLPAGTINAVWWEISKRFAEQHDKRHPLDIPDPRDVYVWRK